MVNLNFLSLDLEMNQPSGAIIQVGYVIGNLYTGFIHERVCHDIKVNEQINPDITKLTGVTQDDVDNGQDLISVFEELKVLHKKYKCFLNPITWGGGDSKELEAGLLAMGYTDKFIFGHRWIDAKTIFISKCFAEGVSHRSGLSKSLNRMGLTFEGKKHNALDDAYNTFKIYRELLKVLEP